MNKDMERADLNKYKTQLPERISFSKESIKNPVRLVDIIELTGLFSTKKDYNSLILIFRNHMAYP